MFIQCVQCETRVSHNHKADPPLRELACPKCGGSFRKLPASFAADPQARHELTVHAFTGTVARLESIVRELAALGPTLNDVMNLLQVLGGCQTRSLEWDREDSGRVRS
jgi:hypothetical protein